eukprot:1189371-Prorocentrum_minimum.AAC.4
MAAPSVQPYYGPLDEGEMASVWRVKKLKRFEIQVRREPRVFYNVKVAIFANVVVWPRRRQC